MNTGLNGERRWWQEASTADFQAKIYEMHWTEVLALKGEIVGLCATIATHVATASDENRVRRKRALAYAQEKKRMIVAECSRREMEFQAENRRRREAMTDGDEAAKAAVIAEIEERRRAKHRERMQRFRQRLDHARDLALSGDLQASLLAVIDYFYEKSEV